MAKMAKLHKVCSHNIHIYIYEYIRNFTDDYCVEILRFWCHFLSFGAGKNPGPQEG